MVSERALAIAEDLRYELEATRLDEIRQAVLSTTTVQEANEYHARVSGLQEALKKHHDVSFDLLHQVTSLRLETERHIGQLLMDIPRQPGERTDLRHKTPAEEVSKSYLETLEAVGLNRETARRFQHLAKVPEAGFQFSLDVTRRKRIIPSRIGIIKSGHASGGDMGFVQKLADYAIELCWPDLREAQEILWQALKREHGWVQQGWREKAMSRAAAKKLFNEVEGKIHTEEMNAAEARSRVQDIPFLGPKDTVDWIWLDREIERTARIVAEPNHEHQEAPDRSGGVSQAPSAVQGHTSPGLSMALGVLGQMDRLKLKPDEFVRELRYAREPEIVRSWFERMQLGKVWLDQAIKALSEIPDVSNE